MKSYAKTVTIDQLRDLLAGHALMEHGVGGVPGFNRRRLVPEVKVGAFGMSEIVGYTVIVDLISEQETSAGLGTTPPPPEVHDINPS